MTRLLLQVVLLLLFVAGSMVLAHRVYELAQGPAESKAPEQAWTPDTSLGRDVQQIDAVPLVALTQTLARPLFFETRRLPSVAEAAPKPIAVPAKRTPAPTSQFRLLGIVQHGDTKRALIEGPSVLLDWYSEGAKLQDWTLTRIESASVLLSFDDQRGELRLFPSGEQN
jgi:hypothetical protein